MKTILTLIALAFAIPASAQIDPNLFNNYNIPNVFWADNSYYYVMPQRQAIYGAVELVSSRYDSRYLSFVASPTAHREIPDPSTYPNGIGNLGDQQGIYVYDLVTNKATLVRPLPSDRYHVTNLEFLEGSPYLLGSYVENEKEQTFIFHPETTRYLPISLPENQDGRNQPLYVKATDSFVFVNLQNTSPEYAEINVLSVKTGGWNTLRLPKIDARRIITQNGRLIVFEFNRTSESFVAVAEINSNNGTIININEPFSLEAEKKMYVSYFGPTIAIQDGARMAPQEGGQEANSVRRPLAILTMNGIYGGTTPDEKIAWYTERSGLYLSDIVKFTDSQAEEFFKNVIKRDAMSRAKQVGTALMIYSSDYDGLLPPMDNWQGTTNPYIKNERMFNGFTYLMNGQNLEDIKDPDTPIGTLDTPYGSAIVRADGTVIWKDRPKAASTATLTELRN